MSGRQGQNPTEQPDDLSAWTVLGYLVAGMAVYGGIGWLVDRWVGRTTIFLLIGAIVGLVVGIVMVLLRLRHQP
jgi:F0F1-type ATP synthase assembly protein I